MDSIVHIENEKFIGRTNFRSGLLNNVVALSVKEVAGVAKICDSHVGLTFRRFFKSDGVKITHFPDGMVIDVCIWLQYGYSAAEVSYRLQENVINTAGSMIDKKIKAVNVKIANVNIPHFEVMEK
jgi:uncharacterized alkaline shock family protein YloU